VLEKVNLFHRHSHGGGSITRTKLWVFVIPSFVNPSFKTIYDDQTKHQNNGTYNSGAAMMAEAYDLPSLNSAAPEAKSPALKK
jgi:hypothetical protein